MQISSLIDHTESTYRRVNVTGDWLPQELVFGAYWDGSRWNGFPVPMFALEDGKALCAEMPGLTFVEHMQAFCIQEGDDEVWCHSVQSIVNGRPMDLYLIGDSWCWELAEECEILPGQGGPHADALELRLRPAALIWLRRSARAAGVPLATFVESLVMRQIEERMAGRSYLDLSGFDALLCIAKSAARHPPGSGIAIPPKEWLRIVDALLLAGQDDTPFHQLHQQIKREMFVEVLLDRLARERGLV